MDDVEIYFFLNQGVTWIQSFLHRISSTFNAMDESMLYESFPSHSVLDHEVDEVTTMAATEEC